ncbi:GrpB family protein [Paenarthrobacter sp. YIM B13468]|uniref:GrpB family protein n=1 Tax=Paenarthrobacter sp. YIM B13468 TaxID=3366295 RepID=UPI00367238A0
MNSPTDVVAYRDSWPDDFHKIAENLRPFLAGFPHSIEHVGSTSVPGLDAKPIIDIDVVVSKAALVDDVILALEAAGYTYQGDLGTEGRQAFDVLPGFTYHHLYLVVANSKPHRDHVDFRDYLRSHPKQADRYAAVKRELSFLLATDRQQYVARKGAVVEELLLQARTDATPAI